MKAIGIDIIETGRIAQTLQRYGRRFLERVFTEREVSYCKGRVPSLAARWAAKEAMGKAFGTGIGDVAFTEIEVVNMLNGKPTLILHGQAEQLARNLAFKQIELSLSHTKDYAVAFVAIE